MMKTRFAVALAVPALLSLLAFADWQVGPDSRVQFVSIKNNTIGEVSHFKTLSGSVTDTGGVEVRVVLVETAADSSATFAGSSTQTLTLTPRVGSAANRPVITAPRT